MPPEKVYTNINVKVIIFDAKTEQVEREWTKNIDAPDRRQWLLKTTIWAVMNGKAIEIVNIEDDK